MVNDTQQIPLGYKQTDVGVIPEDWEVMPMVQMNFDISDGNYSSKYPKSSDFKSMGVPFIRANNIKRMTVIDDDMRFITKSQHAQLKKGHLKKNDVLITTRGEIGQIAFVPDEYVDANINAQIVRINTANSGISSQFFGYYLTQDSIQNSFENSQSGSALKQLPVGKLVRLLVVIPSKKEQEKISEALLSIDSLISKLDQLIQKKKNIKQGAMQELLTGKRRLPGFSGEWKLKSFEEVLKRINAKAHQIQSSEYHSIGLYPVVDQGKKRIVGYSDRKDKLYKCPEDGVIVFGDHTCIVKFVDFNFLVGADGTQIMVAKSGHSALFHSYQLEYKGIISTGYNRHFKFVKEREYVAPKLEEQKAISQVLRSIDREIEALVGQKNKYQDLKQGMMQQLLTGKIRLI